MLLVMTDQQRFDTIAALGNAHIHTPNLDRLAARGVSFTNAYTPVPECLPARYAISSGCQPARTGVWSNITGRGVHETIERSCGPYLPATMAALGYRTFGIGKIHTRRPDDPLGFEVDLRSEELYATPGHRAADAYASFIEREHPEFAFIEQLMGERTEMYYVPQMSPLPAHLCQEAWAADRAVEQIALDDGRPYFGFVSFVGPHPPLAPPIPFNRMYDPDRMPAPVRGDIAIDHLDDFIPWMNHAVFAENVNEPLARMLKARYYGEITYIDQCIGRILDAVGASDTLICFYADHGDHLGDHHAWQKESFFEASVRVPLLLSWPGRLEPGTSDTLVSLTDLFAIATSAAGKPEPRDGIDVLAALEGTGPARAELFAYYGNPGTRYFKAMVREADWKYVYLANGGRELLFDVARDPDEIAPVSDASTSARLRALVVADLRAAGQAAALDGEDLRALPFEPFPRRRIYQFDFSRGLTGFPQHPGELLT